MLCVRTYCTHASYDAQHVRGKKKDIVLQPYTSQPEWGFSLFVTGQRLWHQCTVCSPVKVHKLLLRKFWQVQLKHALGICIVGIYAQLVKPKINVKNKRVCKVSLYNRIPAHNLTHAQVINCSNVTTTLFLNTSNQAAWATVITEVNAGKKKGLQRWNELGETLNPVSYASSSSTHKLWINKARTTDQHLVHGEHTSNSSQTEKKKKMQPPATLCQAKYLASPYGPTLFLDAATTYDQNLARKTPHNQRKNLQTTKPCPDTDVTKTFKILHPARSENHVY